MKVTEEQIQSFVDSVFPYPEKFTLTEKIKEFIEVSNKLMPKTFSPKKIPKRVAFAYIGAMEEQNKIWDTVNDFQAPVMLYLLSNLGPGKKEEYKFRKIIINELKSREHLIQIGIHGNHKNVPGIVFLLEELLNSGCKLMFFSTKNKKQVRLIVLKRGTTQRQLFNAIDHIRTKNRRTETGQGYY